MLELVRKGADKEAVLASIHSTEKQFAENGRIWHGFDYNIPGAWQGKVEELLLVGDKKGGRSSLLLGQDPLLLERFMDILPLPVKLLHVVRNPWDNILSIYEKTTHIVENGTTSDVTLRKCYESYLERVRVNQDIIRRVNAKFAGTVEIRTVYLEDFIKDPAYHLGMLARFLELPENEEWVEACVKKVFDKPKKREGDTSEIDMQVRIMVELVPFLQYYKGL